MRKEVYNFSKRFINSPLFRLSLCLILLLLILMLTFNFLLKERNREDQWGVRLLNAEAFWNSQITGEGVIKLLV